MELMSSLLLCTLLAYFPQTLGDTPNKDYNEKDNEIMFSSSIEYPRKSRQLSNALIKGIALINLLSDLEYVFMDVQCKKCNACMERALKVYKMHYELAYNRSISTEPKKNVIDKQYELKNRHKRNSDQEVKVTKRKGKKKSKSVTVTKYNVDGSVYGLKVKESVGQGSEQKDNGTSTCHVYSVKKTYDCETPESDKFLSAAKRTVGKKSKKDKEKEKTTVVTTEKPQFIAPSFRKRHIDQAEMPDNFEFSIEEMSY